MSACDHERMDAIMAGLAASVRELREAERQPGPIRPRLVLLHGGISTADLVEARLAMMTETRAAEHAALKLV